MIRVFIGSHKRFERCEPVIKYSILKHASEPVDIVFLRPEYFGCEDSGCTGFSKMRMEIPLISGFKGFAIYLDVDMILMSDIEDLWDMREKGKHLFLVDGSTEVAVMDCENDWGTVRELKIPKEWNLEDHKAKPEDLKTAKLLHFTDLKCQPWFYEHPKPWLSKIWFEYEKNSQSATLA